VQQFRRLAAETNPNVQMFLPMAGVVGTLQEGVGHLLTKPVREVRPVLQRQEMAFRTRVVIGNINAIDR
jgi:hypothetical protein